MRFKCSIIFIDNCCSGHVFETVTDNLLTFHALCKICDVVCLHLYVVMSHISLLWLVAGLSNCVQGNFCLRSLITPLRNINWIERFQTNSHCGLVWRCQAVITVIGHNLFFTVLTCLGKEPFPSKVMKHISVVQFRKNDWGPERGSRNMELEDTVE